MRDLWNIEIFHKIWKFTKNSFQYGILKLHVINRIKCLILEIVENYEKVNFIWRKKQKFHIFHTLLMLGMDPHKKQKLLLMIYFKNCIRKKKSAKRFGSILILNAFQILNNFLYVQSNLDVLYLMNLSILPAERRYWMMEYDQWWFERMWYKRHDFLFQDLWVKEFRMFPKTFVFVVDLVWENIEKHSTTFRDAIKVEKRVAVGIWRLATGNSYRTVSKVFGIDKSTVIKITADFVKEVVILASRFKKFLKTN